MLAPGKSKITHISDGSNFLSQNARKYNGKLLIRLSKESVASFKDKIKDTLMRNRGIPAHAMIRVLNPIIRGWSNYHKNICSKREFQKLGNFIFWQLWRWPKNQHGNKNYRWIFNRYFHDNHFSDVLTTKKGKQKLFLYRIAYVPIKYHVKIKKTANPYSSDYDEYFVKRKQWRENLATKSKQKTLVLVKQPKAR